MFKEILSYLYALDLHYKTGHWQCKNEIYYADHLLLDRLSDEAGERIDQVAEKAIGVTGDVSQVNLPIILQMTYKYIKPNTYENADNSKYFQDGLKLENELQACIKKYEPSASVGVKNLLGDLADESEGRIYLLNQRLTKPQI